MGDRITIKFVDSREEFADSSTIYFHWAGLDALEMACYMIEQNITERPGTAMANLAYLWGVENDGPSEMSVYLYEHPPNGDDQGNWVYDFGTKMWTVSGAFGKLGIRTYTNADAVAGAKAENERPYTEEERAAIDANTAAILAEIKRRKRTKTELKDDDFEKVSIYRVCTECGGTLKVIDDYTSASCAMCLVIRVWQCERCGQEYKTEDEFNWSGGEAFKMEVEEE